MINESINKEEHQKILKKVNELKSIQIDNYFIGNYCDAIDINKNWCVGQVVDRKDDKIKIHFEGWSNKFDEELIISKSKKITHFRRFSRGYTGQKTTAYRLYKFKQEDFVEIKNLIKNTRDQKLQNFQNPLDITQILRGKIFTNLDIFMTCNLENIESISTENLVIEITDLLFDYINLFVKFLEYFKENLKYTEVIEKYNDLFLIDSTCAIMASYFEFIIGIKRIFGLDERTSVFYINYDEIIRKFLKNKFNSISIKRICKEDCYKTNFSYNNILTIIISAFIDYFNFLNGFELIFEILFANFDSILSPSTIKSANSSIINNTSNPNLSIPTPFYVIFNFFQIIEMIEPFIDFTSNYCNELMKFKDYFMQRINNMTEWEIKEVDKFFIEGVAKSIRNIFNIDGEVMAAGIIYEEFLLNYHYKCFTSKNLEKRIKGISYINRAADYVDKKDQISIMHVDENGEENFKYLEGNYLFLWMKEKNILEELLGENIHEEILKRCFAIFMTFAKKSAIGMNIYDLLWKAILERHESISSVIKSLVCDLSLEMNDIDKEYNFNRIQLIPLESCNEQLLKFIKNLTINCIKSDQNKKLRNSKFFKESFSEILNREYNSNNLYGIPILYHFLLGEHKNPTGPIFENENIEIALKCLTEIFENTNLGVEIISKYIMSCVENISQGHSIVQSLKLLKILLKANTEETRNYKQKDDSISNLLTQLDKKYIIIDLIINDMKRYFDKVAKYVQLNSSQMMDIDSNCNPKSIKTLLTNAENLSALNSPSAREYINTIFEGNYTHMANIETRLDLIHFILHYSVMKGTPIEISNDHIIKLWDILVLSTLTENEKQILYKFLIQSNEKGGYSDEFSEKICEILFTQILTNPLKFNPGKINLIAFKLFQKYFYLINSIHHRLIILNRKFRLVSIDLLGENTLWEIITQNKNENVRRECSKLLTGICFNLNKIDEDFCNNLWNKFLKNLINNLEDVIGSDSGIITIRNPIGIKGIISLIKTFITELNSDDDIPSQEDLIVNNIKPISVIFVHINRNEKKTLNVGSTELVSQIRDKISFFFDIPLKRLSFKQNRKIIDINDDMKFFKDLIDSNYVVEIVERKNPLLDFKIVNPKELVMENEFIFETLFKLLECDGYDSLETSSLNFSEKNNMNYKMFLYDAWELINMLPTNKKLEEKVFSLGIKQNTSQEDNLQIFESNSIFILTFLLQIIKRFLEEDKNNLWLSNFINNKGLDILISIMMKVKEKNFTDCNSNLGMKCLKDIFFILETVNKLYSDNNPIKIFQSEIIPKLFEVIFYIFRSSFKNDNDPKLKELQADYSKKKNREMIHRIYLKNKKNPNSIPQSDKQEINLDSSTQTYDNIQNSNNEEKNGEELDEVHSTIRKIWNSEFDFISQILNFLKNFESNRVVEILIRDDSFKMQVDDGKRNYNFYYSDGNLLFNLLTWSLIFPKNTKIKELLIERLLSFISDCDNNLKQEFYVFIYNMFFTEEVLLMPKNYQVDPNIACSEVHFPFEFFYETLLFFLKNNKIDSKYFIQNKHVFNKRLKVDLLKITEFMIDYIKKDINETSISNNLEKSQNVNLSNEYIVIGFLSILREFVLINPEIYEFVITKNLFDILITLCFISKNEKNDMIVSNTSILTTSTGRRAAFRLLTGISYNNPDYLDKIINKISEFHKLGFWRSKRLSDWSITASEDKSITGLIGLKNLGCTCYMNSLMQQFYMIPSLRKGIISIKDNENFKIEESVLFHLKTIFASLLCSDRKFYNPKDFCQNFRNYDNQVMNVLEQMDVDEFFNLLIDRLEPYMKGSDQENLIKNHFTGMLVNQSICIGCPHYSETTEPFSSIILSIKNKKTVIESLESFVQGEMLQGDNAYYCDKCDKKVNTLRRQCIKKLPNVLVLVLKRFEFNFDTMVKMKVNDYCEFPFELNMENYTQEYLSNISDKNLKKSNIKNKNLIQTNFENDKTNASDSSEYEYVLTGVIIHTGTADGGHYYSIINNIEDNNWYEFNDAYVTPYDINDLPEEAFGGTKQKMNERGMSNLFKNTLREKGTNAYVLFYTKKSQIEKLTSNNKFNQEKLKYQIQSNIKQNIQIDNYQYWVSKIIFSDEYTEFIQDLIINYNTESNLIYKQPMITKNSNLDLSLSEYRRDLNEIINLNIPDHTFVIGLNISCLEKIDTDALFSSELHEKIFKLVCNVFFTSIIRYSEKKYFPCFMDILKTNINLSAENAEWLIEEFSNPDILTEFVVECPHADVRKLTCGLIYCAMLKISKEDSFLKDLKRIKQGEETENNSLLNMIQTILFFMNRKKQYLGKDFTFFYFLMWRFSSLSLETKEFLIHKNFLKFLIKFFNSKNFYSLSGISGFNMAKRNVSLIEESLAIKIREPKHKELAIKLTMKKEKLSPFEEMLEKKQIEKSFIPIDAYILITFCEIMRATDLNKNFIDTNPYVNILSTSKNYINLSEENQNLVNLKDKILIRALISECKSKHAAIHLTKFFLYISYENFEIITEIVQILSEYLNMLDIGELDVIIKIFRNLILIEDSLKENRIKLCLDSYFTAIIENLKYYKFTEFNIDFIIKFFNKNFLKLSPFIGRYINQLVKLIQWLKENPFAPVYAPSTTTSLFKKRNFSYGDRNQNKLEEQIYMQNYKEKSENRMARLIEIAKKNVPADSQISYDSDEDLIDFKFSVNDKIKYENFASSVNCVLDEMIFVEPYSDLIFNRTPPNSKWVETDKNIGIINLHFQNSKK